METSLYVGLSGQLALQRRMDTIANNVANSNTTGFRSEHVSFKTVLSRQEIAYSDPGQATFSHLSGPLTQTGNALDVALLGDSMLSIATPSGNVYTRDGRMKLSEAGELQTLEGYSVLDQGGGPLRVNPALGDVLIARNGGIHQGGQLVGTLGLFRPPVDAKGSRALGVGFTYDKGADPVTDFKTSGVAQGYVENSNVNAVLEMNRLISVSRAFDALTASLDQSDRKLSDAIRTLSGGRS